MTINEHILKLTGKCNLPESLELSNNYKVEVEGSITSVTDHDNHDGTADRVYKFEPVLVKIIDDKGKSIKAKDTRSESQKLRAILYRQFEEDAAEMDFDQFYLKVMKQIRLELSDLIDRSK